jgi:hypothetical protein
MTEAVCPSCGVAVVPGYVRCPKCKKALPRRPGTHMEGGTAVEEKNRGPLLAIIAAAVIGTGLIIYLGVRSTDKPKPAPTVAPAQPAETTAADTAPAAPEPTETTAQPTGPDPVTVAADLEKNLRKQRLWSSVSVVGGRVEIRSGSCSDPGMAPLVDAAAPSFKAAGLTKLRCLEQSGRVVTDRDL